MLMPWIGRLDRVSLCLYLEHLMNDVFERNIGCMRMVHAPPAMMVANLFLGNVAQSVIEHFDALLDRSWIAPAGRREIELEYEACVGDCLVLLVKCIRDRVHVRLSVRIELLDVGVFASASRWGGRHEDVCDRQAS